MMDMNGKMGKMPKMGKNGKMGKMVTSPLLGPK